MHKAAILLEDCNAADTESHEGKSSVNAKFTPHCKRLSQLEICSMGTNAANEYWTNRILEGKICTGEWQKGQSGKIGQVY